MIVVPRRAYCAISAETASTCLPPGSDRQMTFARAAMAATVATNSAFVSFKMAKASGLRSNATTGPACFSAMLRHIGPPITPRPMKPMVS